MLSSIFLLAALQQQTHPSFHPSAHRVVSGETLSGIAPSMGESWTQLYAANQRVIGGNPNLIYPGEVLYSGPATRSVTVHASSWKEPSKPAPAASGAGSYGHPYYCGDGDGDGYDVPCPAQHAAVAPASPGSDRPVTASVTYSGGTLSASEVGQLWVNAGGPSWAESRAVEIASCESGFNPRAYNPSGASGVWQILGSVVPGNLFNPVVNAENAVAKFKASGDTFAQWVCQ